MSTAKNAILRAKLNGVITELLVKTNATNVIVDDSGTTLAAYLQTLATNASVEALQQAVNALGALSKKDKVSQTDLDDALNTLITGKAEQTALQAEIARATEADELLASRLNAFEEMGNTLAGNILQVMSEVATLNGEDTGKSVRAIANEELAAQLIGESAKESLDTLAEIAAWIQAHPDDASAMNEAIAALQNQVKGIDAGEGTVKKYIDDAIAALKIGDYALASDLTALAGRVAALETTAAGLGALANKNIVGEADLDETLREKVNAASEGNHAHLNKDLLDTYTQTEANLADAVAKKHAHDNMSVLEGISATRVAAWDGKTTVYYADEEPAAMQNGDLWFQIVE